MKRVILLVVFILTIGTLVGGNVYWNQKVKATSENAKQSLKHNASSANATGSIEANSTANGTDSNSKSKSSDTKANSTATNSTATKNVDSKSSNKNKNKKTSVAEIKKNYNALFNELEAQETSKVDQLAVQAKADYVSKKGTKTEVIAKYQTVSQQLEAQADQNFNAIYQQLQYDLEKNGHSLNEAQGYQQAYNSAKEKRTAQLTNSIKSF